MNKQMDKWETKYQTSKAFWGVLGKVVHHVNESFIILLHLLSFSLNVILTINAN